MTGNPSTHYMVTILWHERLAMRRRKSRHTTAGAKGELKGSQQRSSWEWLWCSTVLHHCLANCQSEPQNNWRNTLEPQYFFFFLGWNGTYYKMFKEILHSPLSIAVGEAGQEGCTSWPVTEASCRHSWSTYRKGSQQVGNTHCNSLVSGTRAQHKHFCTLQCSLLPASPYSLGASPLTPVLQSKSSPFPTGVSLQQLPSTHKPSCCLQYSPYSP